MSRGYFLILIGGYIMATKEQLQNELIRLQIEKNAKFDRIWNERFNFEKAAFGIERAGANADHEASSRTQWETDEIRRLEQRISSL